jgi:hypothetical protein
MLEFYKCVKQGGLIKFQAMVNPFGWLKYNNADAADAWLPDTKSWENVYKDYTKALMVETVATGNQGFSGVNYEASTWCENQPVYTKYALTATNAIGAATPNTKPNVQQVWHGTCNGDMIPLVHFLQFSYTPQLEGNVGNTVARTFTPKSPVVTGLQLNGPPVNTGYCITGSSKFNSVLENFYWSGQTCTEDTVNSFKWTGIPAYLEPSMWMHLSPNAAPMNFPNAQLTATPGSATAVVTAKISDGGNTATQMEVSAYYWQQAGQKMTDIGDYGHHVGDDNYETRAANQVPGELFQYPGCCVNPVGPRQVLPDTDEVWYKAKWIGDASPTTATAAYSEVEVQVPVTAQAQFDLLSAPSSGVVTKAGRGFMDIESCIR